MPKTDDEQPNPSHGVPSHRVKPKPPPPPRRSQKGGAGSGEEGAGKSDAQGSQWLLEADDASVVPSFDYRVDFASATAMGVGREVNQDSLLTMPSLGLFAIADGMGGHAAGEIASRVAIEVIHKMMNRSKARLAIQEYAADPELDNRRAIFEVLDEAVRAANDAVIEASEKDEARKGMGTTLDVVLFARDRAFFAHVGDSRSFLIRPTAMLQLTNDHAAYDTLKTSGKRAPVNRFNRSPLTNSIGHRRRVVIDIVSVDIAAGDRVLLCTDGAFNTLEGEPLFESCCREHTVADMCGRLIHEAREHGGTDDATIVAVALGERMSSRAGDAGPRARDMGIVSSSPLLNGLEPADVLSALAAGVEVELAEDEEIPRAVANDRVAYIILDGLVELPNGRTLGGAGLLMGESLLDIALRGPLPKVVARARLLRIRHDDFNQVCGHNLLLAVELYKRLARHLATTKD
jgi:serine/threonine protein phosphatase PrpC